MADHQHTWRTYAGRTGTKDHRTPYTYRDWCECGASRVTPPDTPDCADRHGDACPGDCGDAPPD